MTLTYSTPALNVYIELPEISTNEINPFAIGLAVFLAVLIPLVWIMAPTYEGRFFPPNPNSDEDPPPTTVAQTYDDEPEMEDSQQLEDQQQLTFSGLIEHFSVSPIYPRGVLPGSTTAQTGGDAPEEPQMSMVNPVSTVSFEPTEGDEDSRHKLSACEEDKKSLHGEYDSLRLELDEQRRKLSDSEIARAKLEARVVDFESKAVAREADVMNRWYEVQRRSQILDNLEKQLKEARQHEKDAIAKAREATAEAAEAHQTLQLASGQIDQLQQKLIKQDHELKLLQTDRDQAWIRVGTLEREFEELKSSQQTESAQHQRTIQTAAQEQKKAQDEIQKLTKDLTDMKDDHLVSPLHLKRLKKDLASAGKRIEDLERKLNVKKEGERIWEGRRTREAEHKTRIKALERENAELRQRLEVWTSGAPPPQDGDNNDETSPEAGIPDASPPPPQAEATPTQTCAAGHTWASGENGCPWCAVPDPEEEDL